MTRDEAALLKPGDTVIIDPAWNQIETHRRFEESGTTVISLYSSDRSQTGIVILITDVHGQKWELDVSWICATRSVMKDP